MVGLLRRMIRKMSGKRWVAPVVHAIRYTEPDGRTEVDFRRWPEDAYDWAEWCRQDGCTDVRVQPLSHFPRAS